MIVLLQITFLISPLVNLLIILYFLYLGVLLSPDVLAAREQMNMSGVNYPSLPLPEVQPRPTSVYSQMSSTCSPSASFSGAFNQPAGGVLSPQPHSSYYSGLSGPQHPFYNRVSSGSTLRLRKDESLCWPSLRAVLIDRKVSCKAVLSSAWSRGCHTLGPVVVNLFFI